MQPTSVKKPSKDALLPRLESPTLWYGPRPVRGWSGRHALHRAALASAALAAALVPAVGGAGAAESLRGQVQSLEAQRAALASTEHGALLALYAAEAAHARARREAAALERRLTALEREETSTRRRMAALKRSVAASQALVATTLRALYIDGDPDPIAVVLGAQSLDEVMAGIESLQRATAQNRRLAREARSRVERLAVVEAQLRVRTSAARRARAEAVVAVNRLGQVAADRRATVDDVRERAGLTTLRLAALREQARKAGDASARLAPAQTTTSQDAAATDANTPPAGQTAAPAGADEPAADDAAEPEQPVAEGAAEPEAEEAAEPVSVVPPPGESRTLVVDAVAYHLPGRTASGLPVGPGVVAVDPRLIPLGTRLFIPGYGPGIAADTGSAIKGRIIDLWMPTYAATQAWGRRTVTITIYG